MVTIFTHFAPLVDAKLKKDDQLSTQFVALMAIYHTLPFCDEVKFDQSDLRVYLIRKTVDGVFLHIAGVEKEIRADPTTGHSSQIVADAFSQARPLVP